MKIQWYRGTPLEDTRYIEEAESISGYRYPEAFKALVMEHDGAGHDEYMDFLGKSGEVYTFDELYPFCPERYFPVREIFPPKGSGEQEWSIEGLPWRYVPFAEILSGDTLCFDRENDHVVVWRHDCLGIDDLEEVENIEELDNFEEIDEVADSFEAFLELLHLSED